MRWWIASIVLVSNLGVAVAADTAANIAKLKAVGSEGKGSVEAAAAWRELGKQGAAALMPVLHGFDGATPLAENWLRSALDAVVQTMKADNTKLPIDELNKYLADVKHSGTGRRAAFELICQADSEARARMLPTFMNDPAPELRYDAVESAFTQIRKLEKPNPETFDPAAKDDKAKTLPRDEKVIAKLKELLNASRHFGQSAEIIRELEAYEEKIDQPGHFGYVKRWHVLGVFDNTDLKGYATTFPPEAKLDPKATPAGKTGEATSWKFLDSTDRLATVDLNVLIGKLKNVVAYGYAVVESPVDQEVEFRVASATAVKIFLNGKEIMARESYHQGLTPDSHISVAKLHKGMNTVLIKVCQNDQKEPWAQEWKYQVRITDRTGAKAPVKEVTPAG